MKSKIVIYYDGICFVCSSAMNTLIKMDRHNILYFSPLQSKFAKSTIDKKYLETMDTVIVKRDEKFYTKSNAAFVILEELKNPLRCFFGKPSLRIQIDSTHASINFPVLR